jgi:hypothetical protein
MQLLSNPHLHAIALNPLIGVTVRDTFENLCTLLDRLGNTLSDAHNDPSIGFITATCCAALRYETKRIIETESEAA